LDYTLLTPVQFQAVAGASIRGGMSEAFLVGDGGEPGGWGATYGHRLLNLRNDAEYRSDDGPASLEHFLYARDGVWGLVTSDAEYAVMAGPRTFIADVSDQLDLDLEAAARALVTEWRALEGAGATAGWVPVLLSHVLGEERGTRLWLERE